MSSLSWTASILLLAATVSAATTSIRPVNTTPATTFFTSNSSAATSSPDDDANFEMYFCFLCSGRDPLLIHHCPIYWDYCHLICDDDMSPSTAATPVPVVDAAGAIPTMMATTAPPVSQSQLQDDDADCYVMKLYMSGRYVIVQHMPCRYIAFCFLTCGGGELAAAAADRNKKVVTTTGGTTSASATMTTTESLSAAILQQQAGSSLPADAELCGTQVINNAPWPPPPPSDNSAGGGGGAHRRRRR